MDDYFIQQFDSKKAYVGDGSMIKSPNFFPPTSEHYAGLG